MRRTIDSNYSISKSPKDVYVKYSGILNEAFHRQSRTMPKSSSLTNATMGNTTITNVTRDRGVAGYNHFYTLGMLVATVMMFYIVVALLIYWWYRAAVETENERRERLGFRVNRSPANAVRPEEQDAMLIRIPHSFPTDDDAEEQQTQGIELRSPGDGPAAQYSSILSHALSLKGLMVPVLG
ncbi:hypothetical protein GGR50DRAFT_693119 [Xylaria sp. CBS 124048]|nr:hypothetical protein GGR50DRAFT_693119 [Xylaria sp. CBS 124048]